MTVKISKLNVKIGKRKEISLTLEEAKELQRILNDTFGEQKIVYPVIIPPSPVIIERPIRPWRYWGVTWTVNNKNTGEYIVTCLSNNAVEV